MKQVSVAMLTSSHKLGKVENPSNGQRTLKDVKRGEGMPNFFFSCALSFFVNSKHKAQILTNI
jgi:hypothetical protein